MSASASSSNPTPRERLLRALDDLAEQTPPHRVDVVCTHFASAPRPTPRLRAHLREANASARYATLVDRACDRWRDDGCSGAAVSLALEGAHLRRKAPHERIEIVWTGPATDLVTARLTSAVLFEAIENAKRSVTMFSFAAYSITGLEERLLAAAARGVELRFVLETVYDSGGLLNHDGSASLRALYGVGRFFSWPLAIRPDKAKMHAKFVLVDATTAFVTSANLTEYGIDRNLELGLVVHGGDVPLRLLAHVDKLIQAGALVEVPK